MVSVLIGALRRFRTLQIEASKQYPEERGENKKSNMKDIDPEQKNRNISKSDKR